MISMNTIYYYKKYICNLIQVIMISIRRLMIMVMAIVINILF